MTRPALLPLFRRAAAIAIAAAASAVLVASSSAAQPQPTISQVRHRIAALTSRQDHLIQRLDQLTQQLASARQRLTAVSSKAHSYRSRFQTMRTEIGQMAAYAYEGGTMTSSVAIVTSGDPQRVLSQASMLMQLASNQHQRMQTFITAARKLNSAQQDLQRTETGVATLRKQVAGQKTALTKLIKKQKSMLATLTARQRAAAQAASVGSGGTTTGTYTGPTTSEAQKGQ